MTPPVVRVFVPTCRRAHLLPRALRSLLDQSMRDWVAEVHNDAPDDPAPADVVASFRDSRLIYVPHARTLGGAATFNLAFSDARQPFVAILEDDNTWQPHFLQTMLAAMRANPDITVAWANQKIWTEDARGQWHDANRLVRPAGAGTPHVRVGWPHPAQCFGALHAHGTVLVRTRPDRALTTPQMDLGGVEAVRERSFPHPLLYVREPLGVFGATHTTFRSRDRSVWAAIQVLLAATFLKHVRAEPVFWDSLWEHARRAAPRMTGTLLLAIRQAPGLRPHLARACADDWRHLAVRAVRRPTVFVKLMQARQRQPSLWEFLDAHTAQRARETADREPFATAAQSELFL